jgi:hypothetical protein
MFYPLAFLDTHIHRQQRRGTKYEQVKTITERKGPNDLHLCTASPLPLLLTRTVSK